VWKVVGSPDSPYQSQGTEVVATSERRALEAAVKKWNLNIYPKSVEEFTQGWRATPVRPATDETPSRDQEFTGTWEVVSRNTDEVVHTISGIGNAVADGNSKQDLMILFMYAHRCVQETLTALIDQAQQFILLSIIMMAKYYFLGSKAHGFTFKL
jgi:hypothetical protein